MPATKVDYVALPFVGQPYRDSGHSRTLADLMLQHGSRQAALQLERGDAAARMWQGAGNAIANAVGGWQRQVEANRQFELEQARESRRAEAEGLQLEGARMSLDRAKRQEKGEAFTRQMLPLARRENGLATYDRELLTREFEAAGMSDQLPAVFSALDEQEASHLKVLEARRDAVAGDAFRVLQSGADEQSFGALLEFWKENDALPARELAAMEKLGSDPQKRQQALLAAVSSSPRFAQMLKRDDPVKLGKGDRLVDPRTGEVVVDAPPEAPDTPNTYEAAILAEQDPARRAQLIREREQFAKAGRPPAAPREEPLVAVIGDDGRPVMLPRSQAVGRQPASTRETGRQVTSGDAGDIAEFNTALDDIATVRATLSGNSATGAAAQLGAALPNAVTEFTGWGSDAKQKQAVIDRVKQVIGKTLEGGVLRKEDEAKYTKILPVIGDPPEVVSAKLDGLEEAIRRRQERKIDALDSAGYDTSRFRQRAPAGGGGDVPMIAPDGRSLMVPADKVDEAKRRGARVAG